MIKRTWLLGAIAAGSICTLACGGDEQNKGQARVIERRGPEVEMRQNAPAQVVVLFPSAKDGAADGGVEVVMVESQYASAGGDGQPPQQPAQPTGREILFCSKDADRGVVSYTLDANGNGRKMMLLARINGEPVEVRQAGGGDGVTFYTVTKPAVPSDQAANRPAPADPQQQPQQQNAEQMAQNSPASAGESQPQPTEAPPAQGQMDQAQSRELQQGQPEQAAVIVVYSAGR